MLWPRRRKEGPLPAEVRDTVFADASLEGIARRAASSSDDVWSHFAAAQQALREGDKIGAIQEIRRVEEMESLEARLHLQAWHCLRTLGEPPPESIARDVKGVVVEANMKAAPIWWPPMLTTLLAIGTSRLAQGSCGWRATPCALAGEGANQCPHIGWPAFWRG